MGSPEPGDQPGQVLRLTPEVGRPTLFMEDLVNLITMLWLPVLVAAIMAFLAYGLGLVWDRPAEPRFSGSRSDSWSLIFWMES